MSQDYTNLTTKIKNMYFGLSNDKLNTKVTDILGTEQEFISKMANDKAYSKLIRLSLFVPPRWKFNGSLLG